MTALTLYSAWYCPFAQRTWFALEQLGIAYEYAEVDPYVKSPEWLEISRGLGQVPVLEVQGEDTPHRIPDSLRTMDYLNDRSGGRLLHPDPEKRAEQRFWLDQIGREVIPYFYRQLKAPNHSDEGRKAQEAFEQGLTRLIAANPPAPWLSGSDAPGVLDIALAPFAARAALLLPHYKGYTLPTDGPWAEFHNWLGRVVAHPAYAATIPEPKGYEARLIDFYAVYANGGGQSDVTKVA
ncbi:hypothetical protein ACMU_10695 [Actibacterium mucosum KCTC 23349]|uniref:GST N-terminal domain-containing protein n=1 Tax=Actibacterium mucosum KCTC 23349 TaxID=1454373 RepID=A0A037ZKY8_9RHOB|nr:glutathione S-transferase family protein [Actibacterium mucosum]KAJ56212.1 hypothetical protein ACMU_10695 [Actibacterium mucosum KCTC 23349]